MTIHVYMFTQGLDAFILFLSLLSWFVCFAFHLICKKKKKKTFIYLIVAFIVKNNPEVGLSSSIAPFLFQLYMKKKT